MTKLAEVIDAAKRQMGSYKAVADTLQVHQNRVTEWKKGQWKPDAEQLAKLIDIAGMPELETMTIVNSEMYPSMALMWERMMGNLRAAGLAATSGLATSLVMPTSQINDWRKR